MMDIEDFQRLEFLRSHIELSEGGKKEAGMMKLATSHYVFVSNYTQLKKGLEFFNSEEGNKLWDIRNRDKLYLFHMEIIRLLHNYLASVKSLVDHTRIIIEEVHGSNEFSNEYKLKKEEMFDNSALSHFVQELRNYILHKGIPNTFAQEKFKTPTDSETTSSIILDLSSLRSWNGWRSKSKEYLNAARDDIDLYEIIVSYGSLVIDFYNWFSRRQVELFRTEFEETRKLKYEHDKIIKKYMLSDEELEAIGRK